MRAGCHSCSWITEPFVFVVYSVKYKLKRICISLYSVCIFILHNVPSLLELGFGGAPSGVCFSRAILPAENICLALTSLALSNVRAQMCMDMNELTWLIWWIVIKLKCPFFKSKSALPPHPRRELFGKASPSTLQLKNQLHLDMGGVVPFSFFHCKAPQLCFNNISWQLKCRHFLYDEWTVRVVCLLHIQQERFWKYFLLSNFEGSFRDMGLCYICLGLEIVFITYPRAVTWHIEFFILLFF